MQARLFYTVAFNVDGIEQGFDPEALEGFLANVVAHGLCEYQNKITPLIGVRADEVNVSFDIERAPHRPVVSVPELRVPHLENLVREHIEGKE